MPRIQCKWLAAGCGMTRRRERLAPANSPARESHATVARLQTKLQRGPVLKNNPSFLASLNRHVRNAGCAWVCNRRERLRAKVQIIIELSGWIRPRIERLAGCKNSITPRIDRNRVPNIRHPVKISVQCKYHAAACQQG